jgi:hypothetical protein
VEVILQPTDAAELNPRLKGFVIERLKRGESEWKVIEALMRQGQLDRASAEAYVRLLGPPVYRHLGRSYRTHMMIGAGLWVLAIGLGIAFLHKGLIVVAIGAFAIGMGQFSYGFFGVRRCRALLSRNAAVPN